MEFFGILQKEWLIYNISQNALNEINSINISITDRITFTITF